MATVATAGVLFGIWFERVPVDLPPEARLASVGLAGGIFGALKSLGRGEIREYSDIFNATRHLALQRIVAEARAASANAVIGIAIE